MDRLSGSDNADRSPGGVVVVRVQRDPELTVVVQSPAHAACYVDPGSGAVLLQALLAGALGSLFFVKRAYDALREWVSRKRGDSDKGSQP